MERFMKPVLYVCDPGKYVECPKTACKHNPNAKYHDCCCTTHSRFAKLDQDGDAIIAYDEMMSFHSNSQLSYHNTKLSAT